MNPTQREARRDADILVIGAPATGPDPAGLYPPLPGARREALAVLATLRGPGGLDAARVCALVEQGDDPPPRRSAGRKPRAAPVASRPAPEAREVITTLLAREWRLVHLAGHGDPGRAERPGGLVLSGDQRLGAAEFGAMARVPELVFVNACHLGRAVDAALQRDHPRWAAALARGLIGQGVRCVIAAGWAVDDAPAAAFAQRFYAELLAGRRFIDAVGVAREASWRDHPDSPTWAAYQCYGDPDWVWQRDGADAQRADSLSGAGPATRAGPAIVWPTVPPAVLGDIVSPAALLLALDRLLLDRRLRHLGGDTEPPLSAAARRRERKQLAAEVDALAERFGPVWGDRGDVTQALGLAYAELAVDPVAKADADADAAADPALDAQAFTWLRRAVAAPDGLASLHAVRQLERIEAWQAPAAPRSVRASRPRAKTTR